MSMNIIGVNRLQVHQLNTRQISSLSQWLKHLGCIISNTN